MDERERKFMSRAAEFCRAIVPTDLPSNVGVYCVSLSCCPIPEELRDPKLAGCYGATSLGLCGELRPWLETSGQWAGPGFACLVKSANVDPLPTTIIAHELGHFLSTPAAWFEPDKFEAAVRAYVAAGDDERRRMVRDDCSHGRKWVRATAHVVHRARSLGIGVEKSALDGAGLRNSGQAYLDALRCELYQLSHLPVRRILEMRAPEGFDRLYADER